MTQLKPWSTYKDGPGVQTFKENLQEWIKVEKDLMLESSLEDDKTPENDPVLKIQVDLMDYLDAIAGEILVEEET
jgi:hypothetical protein